MRVVMYLTGMIKVLPTPSGRSLAPAAALPVFRGSGGRHRQVLQRRPAPALCHEHSDPPVLSPSERARRAYCHQRCRPGRWGPNRNPHSPVQASDTGGPTQTHPEHHPARQSSPHPGASARGGGPAPTAYPAPGPHSFRKVLRPKRKGNKRNHSKIANIRGVTSKPRHNSITRSPAQIAATAGQGWQPPPRPQPKRVRTTYRLSLTAGLTQQSLTQHTFKFLGRLALKLKGHLTDSGTEDQQSVQ